MRRTKNKQNAADVMPDAAIPEDAAETCQKEKEEPVKVRFSDYLLLLLTGYGIILIPVVLFIAGVSLLAAWLFGAFR